MDLCHQKWTSPHPKLLVPSSGFPFSSIPFLMEEINLFSIPHWEADFYWPLMFCLFSDILSVPLVSTVCFIFRVWRTEFIFFSFPFSQAGSDLHPVQCDDPSEALKIWLLLIKAAMRRPCSALPSEPHKHVVPVELWMLPSRQQAYSAGSEAAPLGCLLPPFSASHWHRSVCVFVRVF